MAYCDALVEQYYIIVIAIQDGFSQNVVSDFVNFVCWICLNDHNHCQPTLRLHCTMFCFYGGQGVWAGQARVQYMCRTTVETYDTVC